MEKAKTERLTILTKKPFTMPLRKTIPVGVCVPSPFLIYDFTDFIISCAPQLRCYLNQIDSRSVPPFPADLADPDESPNIYVTQPTTIAISAHTPFPPSALPNAASLHSLSPASSPTTADFPTNGHIHNHPHSLSRQHSFPHNHTHSHAPYGTSPSPRSHGF